MAKQSGDVVDRLEAWKRQTHSTNADIGAECGVDASIVSRWLGRKVPVPPRHAAAIAKVMGESVKTVSAELHAAFPTAPKGRISPITDEQITTTFDRLTDVLDRLTDVLDRISPKA